MNLTLPRIAGLLALLITHTNFGVSSSVGFLALFGVSVQTGVIMLEYINQLRGRGHTVVDSAVQEAVLRLRAIRMTMLVATLGSCPWLCRTESAQTRNDHSQSSLWAALSPIGCGWLVTMMCYQNPKASLTNRYDDKVGARIRK